MLKRDLAMGYAGAVGGKVAEKLVGPVAAGLAERLGTKCPQEIVALAGTVGSMEAAAAAEGESLTDDLNLQGVMKNHLMGKAAEGITKVTTKGLHLDAIPRPVEHGEPVVEGRSAPGEPAPEPAGATSEPQSEGAPVHEPPKDIPEATAESLPEPAGDLGERASKSELDEPTGSGGKGRRLRPGREQGKPIDGRGGGRGRARRRQGPRSGELGRGGRKKARTRTVRRGGGGSHIHFKSGGVSYRLSVSTRSEAFFNAIPTGHTVVYTVHNSGGEIIYVGITTKTASRDALNRLYEHLYTKDGEFIGGAGEFRIVGHYDKELEAHALEQHLVDSYDPAYNKDLTPWDTWLKGTPWAKEQKEFRPEWQPNIPAENTLIRFGIEIE
jgi:hypothetical protein